jgi:hypothetical protein
VADYTPVALPGQTYTFTAGGALTGGDLVEVTAANTVSKITTNLSRAFIGVAGQDTSTGGKVTVTLARVIHESVADGSIAAGAQLVTTSTANRQVKAQALVNPDVTGTPTETTIEAAINGVEAAVRAIIGIAITAATDGNVVRWAQK